MLGYLLVVEQACLVEVDAAFEQRLYAPGNLVIDVLDEKFIKRSRRHMKRRHEQPLVR